jgi:hypothetical protein
MSDIWKNQGITEMGRLLLDKWTSVYKFTCGLIFIVFFSSWSSIAQTDCAETIAEFTTLVKKAIEKEQEAGYLDVDTTKGPAATLRCNIHFALYKSGAIGNVRIKKMKCDKCDRKEKQEISERFIQAISGISGVKPCSQDLFFKQPIVYELY